MTERARVKLIRKTPTIDTAAYGAGDRLGSIITFTDALADQKQGIVRSLTVIIESATLGGANLHLFRALPTVASADNAALDITDAEMTAKYLGSINIGTTAETILVSLAASTAATVKGIDLAVDSKDGNLYGVLEVLGTPTFTAADDLTVVLGVETV